MNIDLLVRTSNFSMQLPNLPEGALVHLRLRLLTQEKILHTRDFIYGHFYFLQQRFYTSVNSF